MFGHLLLKLVGGGIDIHAIWKGVSGQARVYSGGGGGRGGIAPHPPRNWKKDAVRGNFHLFHLCSTDEIRGESIHYTCKMEGWADRRVSIVGGGEGALPPPPLEMGKKMLSEEILTSFSLLLMKLGRIDKHCIHAKWKGVGGQALVHGKRGWGLCPPPPRK